MTRATVQSRLDRMTESGVISSWVPQPDPARFGFPVVAFCSLTINQDAGHEAVAAALAAIPEIIEVHTVTGSSDLMARVAARSNPDLQRVLDAVIATKMVQRASSVIVLTLFPGPDARPARGRCHLTSLTARGRARRTAGSRPGKTPARQDPAWKHFHIHAFGRRISFGQSDHN